MMKVSKLLGEHFKEAPADCQIASHALMVRGGYIKQVGTGIFSLYPSTKRITRKIENILIRLNKWSMERGINVREVILLDNAKNVLEKYV